MLSKLDTSNRKVKEVIGKWEKRRKMKIGILCQGYMIDKCESCATIGERSRAEESLLPERWKQQDGKQNHFPQSKNCNVRKKMEKDEIKNKIVSDCITLDNC